LKENLFFRATKSMRKEEIISIFLNLILLPLLCIPMFFGASALKVDFPQANSLQPILYLSGE
jgi:hypothetical protein